MDEDLKIVLTSELEADEQASAQRISAQLPNIAKLINSKSTIKVGVTLDSSNIQGEAQKISQRITKATKTQGVGVTLNLDRSSVEKIQTALNDLRVSPDISQAMTEQLDQMGIQIDKISAKWDSIAKSEEKALTVSLNGTDQLGRAVSYVGTYNTEMGKLEERSLSVVDNLEKQRIAQQQLTAQAKSDNELRVSFLTALQDKLDKVKSKYSDINAPGAIKKQDSLDALDEQYNRIADRISALKDQTGRLSLVDKAEIKSDIEALDRLANAYKNLETSGTKLRKKDVDAIKVDQGAGLDTFEEKLKNSGALTDSLKSRIAELRTELSGVSDAGGMRAFLDGFDQLKGEAGTLIEKLHGVNDALNRLRTIESEINDAEIELSKLRLDPEGNKESISEMEAYLAKKYESKALIENEIASYGELANSARQVTAVEQARVENAHNLAMAEAEISASAREADNSIKTLPGTLSDLEARFKQIISPTETLKKNMADLRSVAADYNKDSSNEKKIEIWNRTKDLIGECRREISELSRVQRSDVLDFKFTQDLEKAKADLDTVKRQWSALFSDNGLKRSFSDLDQSLNRINNDQDPVALKKWNIELSRFKSEVKAAGKNNLSFFDTLKNNLSKVMQWANATTIMYMALRKLKDAIKIVIGLDTAMIDLRKTTNETEAAYKSFYYSANETAKRLGVTTEVIISQTAEWSRLGYTMKNAAKMAENSAIFEAISPELNGEDATDGLISIMKAFDVDPDDVLDGIISKINIIGNEMAVSNKDIVDVMTRSSAAMSAANNTFEETVALATAAIEITRDADSVGNGLKTKDCLYVQKCA